MEFEAITYTVPEWALPALINDDYSGLSDDDCSAIDALQSKLPLGHWSMPIDEASFYPSNDLQNLGDNCVEIDYMVRID